MTIERFKIRTKKKRRKKTKHSQKQIKRSIRKNKNKKEEWIWINYVHCVCIWCWIEKRILFCLLCCVIEITMSLFFVRKDFVFCKKGFCFCIFLCYQSTRSHKEQKQFIAIFFGSNIIYFLTHMKNHYSKISKESEKHF